MGQASLSHVPLLDMASVQQEEAFEESHQVFYNFLCPVPSFLLIILVLSILTSYLRVLPVGWIFSYFEEEQLLKCSKVAASAVI